jgi:hypothetical protein
MSTLDLMHKKPSIRHWEETTSFYGINTTLLVGQIGIEKEETVSLCRCFLMLWKPRQFPPLRPP